MFIYTLRDLVGLFIIGIVGWALIAFSLLRALYCNTFGNKELTHSVYPPRYATGCDFDQLGRAVRGTHYRVPGPDTLWRNQHRRRYRHGQSLLLSLIFPTML